MKREHLWALLALVIAIGLAYVLITLTKDVQSEAYAHCMDEKTKEQVRAMTLQGTEEGFKKHIANLFTIWVQDKEDQPKRARTGVTNGINAYLRAREFTLIWDPPTCESHK